MADKLLESSVQQKPTVNNTRNVVLNFTSAYNRILPEWWSPSRDAFFRDFWKREEILSSAIYSIAARNAAFGWELSGLNEDVQTSQRLLQSADFGGGWQKLITKTTIDLLTCDNGAFWEIIRPAHVMVDGLELQAVKQHYENNENPEWFAIKPNGKKMRLRGSGYKLFDTPLDLPIGISHLDSGRVQRTGDPEIPAIYTDINGKRHKMMWWQILDFVDMPSPIESMNGVGFSAISRIFKYAHTLQSLSTYKDEKLSGRFTRAVHITNADPHLIQDQISQSNENASNASLMRYSQPVIASTFDPSVTPSVATIQLADMPEGFKEETTLEWYISVLALALGVDYGFLAPLPGKGLGTASQSETMARQSRGKSSRLFMDMTSNAINFRGMLPASVRFRYIERDTQQEKAEEEVKKYRAETRQIMIKNGEISPQIARQIATDEGDLNEKYLVAMGEQDMIPGIEVEGDDNLSAQNEIFNSADEQKLEPETELLQEEQSKGLKFDEKQISARRLYLFEPKSLASKIQNVASKAFGKKEEEEFEEALEEYENEIVNIAEAANDESISKDVFINTLAELAVSTILALYAQAYGSDSFEMTDELSEIIEANEMSAFKFANSIYEVGTYKGRPDAIRRRAEMWSNDASYAAILGMISNPDNANVRFEFVRTPLSDSCDDCLRLNGQIHTGAEWLDHKKWLPKSKDLKCSGFRCKCKLEQTNSKTRGNF